jgi:LysM repeat protein
MALKKKSYKIKSGDTLSQIAKDMGMSLAALKQANPKIENVNKIKVGQTITIPSLANIKGSKDPYKGMTKDMMSKMDIKNKDMPKQKEVSRKLGLRGLSPNQTSGAKKSMAIPKTGVAKKRAENERQKKNRERLAALRKRTTGKNNTIMPKPKPKTQMASRTSRRKGRKA